MHRPRLRTDGAAQRSSFTLISQSTAGGNCERRTRRAPVTVPACQARSTPRLCARVSVIWVCAREAGTTYVARPRRMVYLPGRSYTVCARRAAVRFAFAFWAAAPRRDRVAPGAGLLLFDIVFRAKSCDDRSDRVRPQEGHLFTREAREQRYSITHKAVVCVEWGGVRFRATRDLLL